MVTAVIDLERPVYDPWSQTRHTHLIWSRTVARGVRDRCLFGTGSQEEQDLEQTAYLELVRKVPDFDPSKVAPGTPLDLGFRKWVQPFIKNVCEREALRLRNGGTYHTTRTPPRPITDMPDDLPDERPDDPLSSTLSIGDVRCRLSGISLTVESEPDLHTWGVAVGELDTQRERSTWMLGDLVAYGVARFGGGAWAKLAVLSYASETVRLACRMSVRYPSGIRIPQASWSHHVIVSGLELNAALAMLRKAAREKLSRRQLKELLQPKPPTERPVLTRVDRERAPAVAARLNITPELALEVLRLFREKVG